MFEILALSAGIGNRRQPLHQGTRHSGHEHSFGLRDICAVLSILTPSFYKGRSAFTVVWDSSSACIELVFNIRQIPYLSLLAPRDQYRH
jgi:hypothetical protein